MPFCCKFFDLVVQLMISCTYKEELYSIQICSFESFLFDMEG